MDAVAGNASVGFPAGLEMPEALAWWRGRLADQQVRVLVERDGDGRVVGTVQLVASSYPNGRRRREVAKLLVHSRARRRGIGERLMRRAEEEARRSGLLLLYLDTESGSDAQRLYQRLGWRVAGEIPDFAYRADGVLRPTTFMYLRIT